MNRFDFINHFKDNNPDEAVSEWPFLEFKVLLTSTKNSESLGLMYINSRLESMYESLNITNGHFLTKGDIDFKYDYYYEEDNPDGDYCQYLANLNLNKLYDKLIDSKAINNNEMITLYRVETKDNKGLYDGIGYTILLNTEDYNHPGPEKENKFMNIFAHTGHLSDNKYKAKWLFAFSDEDQLKGWLGNKTVYDLLVKHEFQLKMITINSSKAIIGDSQVIYVGTDVEKVESLPLNAIEHLFKKKKKNTLHV